MDEDARALLFIISVVVLAALGVAMFGCAMLSDVVRWAACDTLMDFTMRTVHAVGTLFGHA